MLLLLCTCMLLRLLVNGAIMVKRTKSLLYLYAYDLSPMLINYVLC